MVIYYFVYLKNIFNFYFNYL